MKKYLIYGQVFSLTLYTFLHFVHFFFEGELFRVMLAVFGLCIIVFSSLYFAIHSFKLPLFLFLSGTLILLLSGGNVVNNLLNGLNQMRNLIGLIVVIPMISWVLREKSYIEDFMNIAKSFINTSRKLYSSIIVFMQVMAYFLNFASIPMMYQFVNVIIKQGNSEAIENFKSTSILRGFALFTLWGISSPSFIFAVEALEASLFLSIIQGLAFAICGIVIAVIFSYIEEKKFDVDITAEFTNEISATIERSMDSLPSYRNIVEFILLTLTLFGLISLALTIYPISLTIIIPMVVVIWTTTYYMIKRKIKRFLGRLKLYLSYVITYQSYQVNVMLGAGVLIFALNQTDFGLIIINSYYYIQEIIPFFNFLYLLPIIIILLSFLGLGPLTVLVLVAGILETISLPYPPELIVLTITSGSAISILLSPLIMPIIALNGVNRLGGFKNGIQYNAVYAVIIYILVQVYVQIMIFM